MKKILSVIIAVCLMLTPFAVTGCVVPTTLMLSAKNGITELKPGESVQLSTNSSAAVTYELTQGESKATITDAGLLTVNADTEVGTKIKVAAKTSSLTSNELLFTVVHIPLTAIAASVNTTSLVTGGTAMLSYVLTPANTTQTDIKWEVVNDYRQYSITGNTLTVDEGSNVPSGDIEIQAYYGSIRSNILTVEVVLPTDKLSVDADDEITVKNFSTGTDTVFAVNVTDDDGDPVEDANVTFEVIEGKTLIDIMSDGYDCTVKLRGHGTAKIAVKIDNIVKHTVTVNCIKTPARIELPAFILDKANQRYAVGKDQPVDFAAVIPAAPENDQACTDITYTFTNIDDGTDTGLATYSDGKITFKKTGRIKVTATTNSGNNGLERVITRDFIVNDGKNVSTWEEAKAELESGENAEVNFVVTQKPGTESRYSLVPQCILDGSDTLAGIVDYEIDGQNVITYKDWYISININESVKINGNNHPVDMSALKKIKGVGEAAGDLASLRFPSTFILRNDSKIINVELNDLKVWGNVEMDGSVSSKRDEPFAKSGAKLIGVQSRAIEIGADNIEQNCNVTMDNIEIRNFHVGMRIGRTLTGSVCRNLTVSNCYSNGIEVAASILEFNNLKIGICGATGLELGPESSDQAKGADGNLTNQKISFTGKLEVNNPNSGNTQYMQDYTILGQSIVAIINGVLNRQDGNGEKIYSPAVQSHIVNSKDEFMFVAFVFQNPMDSVVENQENLSQIDCYNTINIGDIAKDSINEEAEFIILPVIVTLGADINFGYALVRNWLYRAPSDV